MTLRPPASDCPFRLAPLVALAVVLAGCTAFERGAEQGDPPTDAVTGCPDLSGAYALQSLTVDGEPDPGRSASKPSRLDGSVFSPRDGRAPAAGDLSRYAGVIVRSKGTHALELHFVPAFGNVMAELESIRQHQRPRYAEWYRLMQPAGRAAFVARNGEPALQRRLSELGPATGPVVRLDRGVDFTCEDGWVELPREFLAPVRMTLDPDGHLVFESKELTYTVWGGWGDQSWRAPTGAYLGTARWTRDASLRPWDPDEVAQRHDFPRPADVVEAEQRAFAANNQRHAEAIYATPDEVRDALTPMLADGVAIADIRATTLPFKGARVRIHAVPADPSMPGEMQRQRLEWFLAALRESDPSHIEDSEVVKRVISSGGRERHEFEIHLDTHPSVQPRRAAREGVAAVAFVPPPAVPPPSQDRPEGFAPLETIEARVAPHLADGCRIATLRYAGGAVVLAGEATTMRCVSDTMRAMDQALPDAAAAAGPRIELLQIAAVDGGYTFEIRLPGSELTKA